MTWVKKTGWEVTAFYKEQMYMNNETPISEEEFCLSKKQAEKAKREWEENPDIEDVDIEEVEKEIWE